MDDDEELLSLLSSGMDVDVAAAVVGLMSTSSCSSWVGELVGVADNEEDDEQEDVALDGGDLL